ncbi:MAG TPA: EamA family transporter [Methylomirabilota bacterium]|nr:EamA family transporter [Methylomirabilota bacterium]
MSAPSSPARLRGLLLIGLAAVSWGTTGSVTTVLVQRAGATPLVIGAVRMLLAAALLLLAARLLGGGRRVAREVAWRCVALGACMAGFQAAYFTAVTLTGIAVAALIAICSAPLAIAALAAAFLGERLTPRLLAALALGVGGTALLILGPRTPADLSPRFLLGVALAGAAALAYALYVVLAKAALARSAPLPLAALNFSVAAVLMAPVLLAPGAGRQIALGWPWLLYLGAVATAGAYAVYTIGLRDVSASAGGIASLLEPLTATLLGTLVFGESLGAAGVAGAFLLGVAFTLLVRADAGAHSSPMRAGSPGG